MAALLVLAAAACAEEAKPAAAPADILGDCLALGQWQPLWDGKTLDGWHKIGTGQWTIEDGAIIGRKEAKDGDFGHLVTDKAFKDFTIRGKYKALKGNSGLYFRIEEKGASGVSGFQAEIDPAKDAGGLYETNGRAWVVQPRPEDVKTWYRPGEWNEMDVTAVGRRVVVRVNGRRSAEVLDDPGRTEGRIALQLHGGNDMDVRFKDIEILEWTQLTPGPGMAGWAKPTGDWAMVGEAAADAANEKALAVKPGQGVIYNGPKGSTANIFTEGQFGDSAAHIEFMIPAKSNSGVYFMGRYEIQVYDSYGVQKDKYPGIECGGIYPRWVGKEIEGHSPRVNASLPPGRWQTFDVIFLAPRFDASGNKTANARFVKVVHNGQVIHENIEVTGPTRAAAFEDEKSAGPLMIQGDHGPVAYRNVRILPLKAK
jgi:hypothetical protein